MSERVVFGPNDFRFIYQRKTPLKDYLGKQIHYRFVLKEISYSPSAVLLDFS